MKMITRFTVNSRRVNLEKRRRKKRASINSLSFLYFFFSFFFFCLTPEEDGVNADGFAWIAVTDVIKSGVYFTPSLALFHPPEWSQRGGLIEPERCTTVDLRVNFKVNFRVDRDGFLN